MTLHESLLDEICAEFPGFAIIPKRASRLQRAIGIALAVVTLGGQRRYLSQYHTAMFGRLYVPDAWARMDDEARTILLCHERVHLRQRRRMGDVAMAAFYLFPPFFLAWGRARIEWEAYTETLRATARLQGIEAARALEDEIVRRFVGPDYGWMWPFPKTIRRWVSAAIAAIEAEGMAVDPSPQPEGDPRPSTTKPSRPSCGKP